MTHADHHVPLKAVLVPCSTPVDISQYLPIVDHPLFQKLRGRKQLGINSLVFPGAVHTRFEHALGVLGLTERMCRLYHIAGDDKHLLCGYALLHDIGHGPFSHQLEPVIGGSHNQNGIAVLGQMQSALRQCGLSTDALTTLFTGDSPLRSLVSDRNLGSDKLDYLRRDSLHIGFSGMPDIESIITYSCLRNGVWAVEEKFIEDIKRIQKFYSYLHQHGYLNKTALSIQRVFQRAVQEELKEGRKLPGELWDLTDAELEQWLATGRSSLAKRLVRSLADRSFHRTAYVLKPRRYAFVERNPNNTIAVHEWARGDIWKFSQRFSACTALSNLEDELAATLQLQPGEVLFAAMPYFSKLLPQDIKVFSKTGGREYWLFENDRDHFRSLEGDYLRTFAIRVIVPPAHLRKVAAKSSMISAFLEAKLAE